MHSRDIDILFVEDSMDDAELTIRALKKSGFANTIHHARDGAEALDYLCGRITDDQGIPLRRPSLILLDLKMPKISGIRVLEHIKGDPELRTIPVVILTSSKEDPDVERCYELGANSYIVKPVESDNFFQVVKEIGLYWIILSQLPGHGNKH